MHELLGCEVPACCDDPAMTSYTYPSPAHQLLFCMQVENHLKRHAAASGTPQRALTVLPCHAAIDDAQRTANIGSFLAPPGEDHMALICTDRRVS